MSQTKAYPGRVIFDHFPKTAGQAVNAWLKQALGNGCVSPNLIGVHRDLIREYGGLYSIVSAHITFNGEGLDQRYQYLTLVREPIDRAISWLFFVVNNHDSSQLPGLWELVQRFLSSDGDDLDPHIIGYLKNTYVEHFSSVINTKPRSDKEKLSDALSVIGQYDVWGVYHEMTGFLADVAALIGLAPPDKIEPVNVTRSRPSVNSITPKLRKRLEDLNALDLEFYDLLCERWHCDHSTRLAVSEVTPSGWMAYNPIRERCFSTPGFTLLSVVLKDGAIFSQGQILCFQIEFSLSSDIDELEIGIHVWDEFGRWAFGTNTSLLDRQLRRVRRGTHRLSYYLLADLPEGSFTAGFAFADHAKNKFQELAWFDRLVTFRIQLTKITPSIGYVSMPVDVSYCQIDDVVLGVVDNAIGYLQVDAVFGDVTVSEKINLPVLLVNSSDQTWVSTFFYPLNLSYRWISQAGDAVVTDGLRTPLPISTVLPGQSLAVQMRVVAPVQPGRYQLQLMPVQEMQCWFDERGFTPGLLDVDVVAIGKTRCYVGGDERLATSVGRRDGIAMCSTGQNGFLLYGPYLPLPAGRYVARVQGCAEDAAGLWMDVCADKGSRVLARFEWSDSSLSSDMAVLPFTLAEPAEDLEVRVWVTAAANVRIDALRIEPVGDDVATVSVGPEEEREIGHGS